MIIRIQRKKNPRKCRAKISNRIQPKMHSIEHNHFYSNLFSLLSAYLPKNTNLSWMQCTTTTSITTKKGGGILRIWVVLRKKTLAATLAPEISTKVSFFQPHHHQSCCIFSCVLPFCLVHQVNLKGKREKYKKEKTGVCEFGTNSIIIIVNIAISSLSIQNHFSLLLCQQNVCI